MVADVDPAVQRRRLRSELRRLRTHRQLTQKEVAERVGWSPSKLIRIETGQVGLSPSDLKALLNEYNVSDSETISSLAAMAKEGRRQQWGRYRDVLNPDFLTYLRSESSAVTIRQAEPQVIPGLLQTEEYARAVIQGVGGTDLSTHAVDRQVEVRMKRQEIFDRPNPPEMFFIIDESAMRRPAGDADAMRRQLRHLRKIATLDHVHVRVVLLDSGIHPGLRGSFVLLEFPEPEDDDILFLESSQTSLVTKDDTEAIDRYHKDFAHLETIAASEDETARLIVTIDADLERP
ncbi:helix-turn-helix transcriptional regulator [Micromonospora sp. NPDC049089]|uniref:helix-turn-helix domain-containing protein n=1 Tax=Micromonospora sp. NPDC049089 TaxID=3155496 RepID=UPI0033EE5DFF